MATPLADLVDSWIIDLKAARKSPSTIKTYSTAVRQYLAWLDEHELPAEISKAAVNTWLAGMLDAGAQGTTAAARQLGVRRFSAWLADEGEQDGDPLANLVRPKLDTKVVDPFSADEIRALLAACQGKDFRARRDEAALRILMETGCRADELLGMTLDDVDPRKGTALIRGKGGKERRVPLGPATCRALDRYMRTRRSHKLAASPKLWLGDRGRGITYAGMRLALLGRAEAAGIEGFHMHRCRHTLADRWLEAGGSEGGLMSVAGWSDPTMIRRYSKARAEARAIDEAKRLGLGDL